MRVEYLSAEMLDTLPQFQAEVIVVMPATDPDLATRSAKLMARRAGERGLILVVYDNDRQGFIPTANQVFRNTRSAFFAYVAQDAFAGRLWLRVAMHHLEKTGKGMLAFNDGKWHGLLASFGMVRREWARELYDGDLFNPAYQSHYGDAELTLVARAHDQLCYAPRSVMIEIDWEKDDKPVNDADRKIFLLRGKSCFDGLVPSEADCQIFPQPREVQATADMAPAAQVINS